MSETTQDRLIESAHQIYLKEGTIPIGFSEVAEHAGVSRTLVYSHFSDPAELVNAVLDRQSHALETAGLANISHTAPLETVMTDALEIYFDHLKEHGTLIHSVSQDSFMAGKLSPDYTALRNKSLIRLSRVAMKELKLSARMSLPLTILIASLAEEAARLVRARKSSEDTAKEVMIRSAVQIIDGLALPN